jgi:hypothetical protein
MRARDPRDRKYPARLTLSYVVSCIVHALLALLLFSIASSSSQEGASQSIQGGEIVTVEHRAVAQAQPVPAPSAVPPVPHAPVIAPVPHHAPAPQTAAQKQPQNLHELARNTPNATPNPKPVPQSSAAPNPQPTQQVFEPKPEQAIPAVPISVAAATITAITIKTPPTAVPSPAPSAAPKAVPTAAKAQPTTAPTRAPATPAPISTAVALKPATIARATAAPASPAPPGPIASVAPAKTNGVPSPGPTSGPAQANNKGTSPTPGPKGTGAPGPHAGAGASTHPGPARPVTVQPTSAPPSNTTGGSRGSNVLNNKLRALLLPTGTGTTPKQGHIAPGFGAINTQLDPTPPPDVIARTQYTYESGVSDEEKKVKMWVTSVRKEGPISICTGWLLTYPLPPPMSFPGQSASQGASFTIGGGGRPKSTLSRGEFGQAPLIEANATFVCFSRLLKPFQH